MRCRKQQSAAPPPPAGSLLQVLRSIRSLTASISSLPCPMGTSTRLAAIAKTWRLAEKRLAARKGRNPARGCEASLIIAELRDRRRQGSSTSPAAAVPARRTDRRRLRIWLCWPSL